MVIDATLGCLTPEMDNVRVIPVGKNAGVRQVGRHQVARPETIAFFFVPRSLAVAGQAVDKDETVYFVIGFGSVYGVL